MSQCIHQSSEQLYYGKGRSPASGAGVNLLSYPCFHQIANIFIPLRKARNLRAVQQPITRSLVSKVQICYWVGPCMSNITLNILVLQGRHVLQSGMSHSLSLMWLSYDLLKETSHRYLTLKSIFLLAWTLVIESRWATQTHLQCQSLRWLEFPSI